MSIQKWGFFSVPHLLWHRTSAYTCNGHLRGVRTRGTHTICRAFGSAAVTACFYDLGLSRLGSELPTFRLRGEHSNLLRHRRGLNEMHKKIVLSLLILVIFKYDIKNIYCFVCWQLLFRNTSLTNFCPLDLTASDKSFVLGSDEMHHKNGTYKGMYHVNFHAGFLNWVILLFIWDRLKGLKSTYL